MNLVKEIAEKTTFEQLKASKEPLATKKNKMFASGKYEIYRKGIFVILYSTNYFYQPFIESF